VNAPRWFFLVLAACAVLLTLSIAYKNVRDAQRETWVRFEDAGVLNSRTGVLCGYASNEHYCIDLVEGRRMRPTLDEQIASRRRALGDSASR
jgi:hypothetical protein